MRKTISIITTVFLLLVLTTAYSQDIWVGKDGNIRNINARAMLINDNGMYLATKNELYTAADANDEWKTVFYLPSGTNEITCLAGTSRNIFIGTNKGLFRSQDSGATWKNVFRTIIPDKNSILAIEASGPGARNIIIGTKQGVFSSDDSGNRWTDISEALKNRSIKAIARDKFAVYAGGESGLYIRRNGSSGWERLYVLAAPDKNGEEEAPISDDAQTEREGYGSINCVTIEGGTIYTAADRNILSSADGGKTWTNFPVEGLAGSINYILPPAKSAAKMYCATTRGVFEFDKNSARWLELYKGTDKNLNAIQILPEAADKLWAITDKGLYKLQGDKYIGDGYVDIEKSLKTVKATFDSEPTFQELQRAAIRFAEVGPEKITAWRREARMRALLPKVSLGYDADKSTNAEIYTSATKEYILVGPDNLSSGWDMSVSWELGDLIWSDDQTNIDVRSRLMVQLRNDILDELRRAYYERKRIQFELMTEPPKDIKARFDKELRLKELTSHIDDLTGNYLSTRIGNSE